MEKRAFQDPLLDEFKKFNVHIDVLVIKITCLLTQVIEKVNHYNLSNGKQVALE